MKNLSKFESAVKNKAHERVQARIEKLRADLAVAFLTFEGGRTQGVSDLRHGMVLHEKSPVRLVLKILLGEKPRGSWPAKLWEDEEKKVAEELIAIMDPLQRAMNAKEPGLDDCSPEQKEAGAQSENPGS